MQLGYKPKLVALLGLVAGACQQVSDGADGSSDSPESIGGSDSSSMQAGESVGTGVDDAEATTGGDTQEESATGSADTEGTGDDSNVLLYGLARRVEIRDEGPYIELDAWAFTLDRDGEVEWRQLTEVSDSDRHPWPWINDSARVGWVDGGTSDSLLVDWRGDGAHAVAVPSEGAQATAWSFSQFMPADQGVVVRRNVGPSRELGLVVRTADATARPIVLAQTNSLLDHIDRRPAIHATKVAFAADLDGDGRDELHVRDWSRARGSSQLIVEAREESEMSQLYFMAEGTSLIYTEAASDSTWRRTYHVRLDGTDTSPRLFSEDLNVAMERTICGLRGGRDDLVLCRRGLDSWQRWFAFEPAESFELRELAPGFVISKHLDAPLEFSRWYFAVAKPEDEDDVDNYVFDLELDGVSPRRVYPPDREQADNRMSRVGSTLMFNSTTDPNWQGSELWTATVTEDAQLEFALRMSSPTASVGRPDTEQFSRGSYGLVVVDDPVVPDELYSVGTRSTEAPVRLGVAGDELRTFTGEGCVTRDGTIAIHAVWNDDGPAGAITRAWLELADGSETSRVVTPEGDESFFLVGCRDPRARVWD